MPGFFRPNDFRLIHHGNLPHWRQSDVVYFVTTRLADSMPGEKLLEWRARREAWCAKHGIRDAGSLDSLTDEERHEFHNTFTRQWHEWLDAGAGECLLRRPEVREVLVKRLSKEPSVDAWVVMPNHFHALVAPGDETLGIVLQKCKGGSAREIHAMLGRTGALWQKEPFDHIVRSEAQWRHFRRYVAENPIKAKLKPTEYSIGLGDRVFPDANALLDHLSNAGADH